MAHSKTSSSKPAGKGGTEADANAIDSQRGASNRSGKDAASHTKAASGKGAGGGKKQKRQH